MCYTLVTSKRCTQNNKEINKIIIYQEDIIMAVEKLTLAQFEEKVIKADKPVLVDFYADWCGPCKMMAPVLEEISNERDDVAIYKVNVDEDGELAQRFGVMSIPTFISFKDGEMNKKEMGARPKSSILEMF